MPAAPFWQPAEAHPQLWRTILGFVLVMAIWFAVTYGVLALGSALTGRTVGRLSRGADFTSAAVLFLTFLGFHIGLALVLPLLHRRSYTSLFGPQKRLTLRHLATGTAVTLSIALALAAFMRVEPLFLPAAILPEIARAQPLLPWLTILPAALVLIFLQSLGEELVFRGYLLQQLHARFRSPMIWAVLPALGFGLLHYDATTYGPVNAALYVLNAAVSGTFAAFVTARTGNLAAAAGLHFGNNASMTILGIKGNFEGFALFTVQMDPTGPYTSWSILTQTAALSLAFVVWRGAIAKPTQGH